MLLCSISPNKIRTNTIGDMLLCSISPNNKMSSLQKRSAAGFLSVRWHERRKKNNSIKKVLTSKLFQVYNQYKRCYSGQRRHVVQERCQWSKLETCGGAKTQQERGLRFNLSRAREILSHLSRTPSASVRENNTPWAYCIKPLPEKNSGYFNRSFVSMVKLMVT